jgi:hypothetical protein
VILSYDDVDVYYACLIVLFQGACSEFVVVFVESSPNLVGKESFEKGLLGSYDACVVSMAHRSLIAVELTSCCMIFLMFDLFVL